MGDRAIIVTTDGNDVSPSIYVHWAGEEMPTHLAALKSLMADRADVTYAAARLIGIVHEANVSNLSLGVWNTDPEMAAAVLTGDAEALEKHSPGDAGLIVVRVDRDYEWQAFGGYLADQRALS